VLDEQCVGEGDELVGESVRSVALRQTRDVEVVAADLPRVALSAHAFADAQLHRHER
jgi:hypothetical protein